MEWVKKIPLEVRFAIAEFKKNGYEAFIVGGCVRDLLCRKEPEDWDLTTNASPETIQKIFPDNFLDNKFGTVTARIKKLDKKVKNETDTTDKKDEFLEIEITPYRIESKYSDKRHPDKVEWAENIEEDLSRRDFTVNAIALSFKDKDKTGHIDIIDPFNGRLDLEKKIIQAVRDPNERFSEDALRMMRAARFSIVLGEGWRIEDKTISAIKKNSGLMTEISQERIRDEFLKIMDSPRAAEGIERLRELGLLNHILPEVLEGYQVGQNKHHLYDCYEHSLRSLDYAARKGFNRNVKTAAFLHDVGKPRSKKGEGPDATFYNHEMIGAKMAKQILQRLKFPKKDLEKIVLLVRYHLFYYNVGEVGESSVRRLVRNVGMENMDELLQVRMADRIGSGCPKAEPYKLRHLKYLIEKTEKDPISVKMLKASGEDVMSVLNIPPGPKVGIILDILLGYVLENPELNEKDILLEKVKELGAMDEKALGEAVEKAREERNRLQMKSDEMTKKKYWVT